ncbi:MAG: iron-containing alcohol dehydrogenase [Clostridiales bacterium]|nr:iron-containing alcohol dehydrogenase [Clostridiales bacterium]
MFTCRMPATVCYGENAMDQLPKLCKGAKTVAVFSDRGIEASGILRKPLEILANAGIAYQLLLDLPAEPTCDQAQQTAEAFRKLEAEAIVAIGGGSVMDIAKLCAITADGLCTVRELIDNPALGHKSMITVMIPTTAGTGAEATPNAIVAVPEKELKVGIVSEEMIPDSVILDGEMIRNLPSKIAAATGVDALCHAIECYTSKAATPFSDMYALEALKLIFPNIQSACMDPDALQSKNAMLLAAFYGGVAIACSGTTAVHALSYPLGGKYHIPHGAANAMMLMPVMRFNLPACSEAFARVYDALGETGAANEEEKAMRLLDRMEEIVHNLEIPVDLKSYGVTNDDLEDLVTAGMQVQRLLKNNLRPVTADDARSLYMQRLP